MTEVILSDEAKDDLSEIYDYIAADNRAAADRLLDSFEKVFERISSFPEIGRPRSELREKVRSIPDGNFVIFYRPWGESVLVIRILHGARDLEELFS